MGTQLRTRRSIYIEVNVKPARGEAGHGVGIIYLAYQSIREFRVELAPGITRKVSAFLLAGIWPLNKIVRNTEL